MKSIHRTPLRPILFFILIPILISGACSQINVPAPATPPPEGTYPVDPLFVEFHRTLGGPETLGPAITPLILRNHYRLQYTSNALLVFDTQATPSQRYLLFPLGLTIGVSDPPTHSSDPDARYVDGHVIYPEFLPLYDRLGGARFVGRPLTELRYNPEKGRLEQYFENLGFYRLDSDPPGEVRLLAYGAYVCDVQCRYAAIQASIPSRQGTVVEPFATAVSRLGPGFVGRPISEPYLAPDGNIEIIFDNLVLFTQPGGSGRVFARPILELTGFLPHPLEDRNPDDRMVFFSIQAEKGHNVPKVFSDYLAQHGSMDISGPPITEVFEVIDEILYRQCFTNLCLDYHRAAPAGLHIRPAPMGMVYKAEYYQQELAEDFTELQSLENLTLKVWEGKPILTALESQEIRVAIFEDQVPLANQEPILVWSLPGSFERRLHFPPTDDEGQSILHLPPIEAPNGTLIPYQVCLSNLKGEQACIRDNYLIWGNP